MMFVAVLGIVSLLCALGSAALYRITPRVTRTRNSVTFNVAALRTYDVATLKRMTRGSFLTSSTKQRPVSRRSADMIATVILSKEAL
jgi:hypothetical protein